MCVRVHFEFLGVCGVWLCVNLCMCRYVSPFQHRVVSFEVCLPCRSLAENTGMAICDTIDTWHVNIDNNAVIKPPAGLPFPTFIGFGCGHNAPPVHSNMLFFSLNFQTWTRKSVVDFIDFCLGFVEQLLTHCPMVR